MAICFLCFADRVAAPALPPFSPPARPLAWTSVSLGSSGSGVPSNRFSPMAPLTTFTAVACCALDGGSHFRYSFQAMTLRGHHHHHHRHHGSEPCPRRFE